MEKEILHSRRETVTLNVTANRVDSYRRKEETQNTVRVYENGNIGIAGSLGAFDEDELTEKAIAALENGIAYPCLLESRVEESHHDEEILAPTAFLPSIQRLLERLSAECPRFAISNKVSLTHSFSEYKNSKGAFLQATNSFLSLVLLFQNRGAGNLYDCYYGTSVHAYDEDAVVADCKAMYDAFYRDADIEEGEYPVFIEPIELFGSMLNHFVGELYVSGASLLSGKLGQKVANENLSVYCDRDPETSGEDAFFDDEGQVPPNYRQPLLQDGVFTNVLVTKGTAEMLQLPHAATSSASYDGVPSLGLGGLYVKPTASAPSDIAPGKAVLVMVASGGDMTPDGHFATPVQMAYLVENGKLIGRLPELNISGDFSDLLGDGYLGCVPNTFFPSTKSFRIACNMKVTK